MSGDESARVRSDARKVPKPWLASSCRGGDASDKLQVPLRGQPSVKNVASVPCSSKNARGDRHCVRPRYAPNPSGDGRAPAPIRGNSPLDVDAHYVICYRYGHWPTGQVLFFNYAVASSLPCQACFCYPSRRDAVRNPRMECAAPTNDAPSFDNRIIGPKGRIVSRRSPDGTCRGAKTAGFAIDLLLSAF